MKAFLNYFLRGLLFFFPVFATFYVIYVTINWLNVSLNNLLFNWLQYDIPGLGIITVILLLAFVGFLFKLCVSQPIINFFERLLSKTPIIKIIYSSIRDLTEAFVGDKKKFNQPVVVTISDGVERFGFLTEEHLSNLGITDRVAVYCPHSYNFSGNLYLVHPGKIRILDENPSDVMKFVISAGVTKIDQVKQLDVQ